MTQTIARIYESSQHASDAAADLRAYGFSEDSVHLVAHPGGDRPAAIAAMVDALAARGVEKGRATSYAEEVVQGGAIVTVTPRFGMAIKAEYILNAYKPVGPVGYDSVTPAISPLNEQSPLSAAFNLPLLYNEATPFSKFWNLPVLIDAAKFTTEGWAKLLSDKTYIFASSAQLSDKIAPLSAAFNWKLLSDKPFVFDWLPMLTDMKILMNPPKLIDSSKHFTAGWGMLTQNPVILKNWALLSDKIAPLSEMMGWKLLTAKQYIFSTWPMLSKTTNSFPSLISGSFNLTERFGMLLNKEPNIPLVDDPAPLSSKFGWSLLSGDAAPLSSKFAWPVLSTKQISLSNWPLLSGGATPLSNAFSLPVLIKDKPAGN